MAKTVASSPTSPSGMRARQQPAVRLPARERLLAAAEQLFYQEGFNSVGIDRVIEVAGVAKASLYDCFGSKEELVRTYLASRFEAKKAAIEAELVQRETPRERLLVVFDMQSTIFREPNYRGCAFVKASAEARPDSSVGVVCDEWRQWLHALFRGLAEECGVADPTALAHQLVMLYDGASVSARMDHRGGDTAQVACATAAALLDMAVASRKGKPKAKARAVAAKA